MRGRIDEQPALFHTFHVEDRIRADHPLRDVKRRADRILAALSAEFAQCDSRTGRPSVPPERLLKAQLLLALYSLRSERQLCERIETFFWSSGVSRLSQTRSIAWATRLAERVAASMPQGRLSA